MNRDVLIPWAEARCGEPFRWGETDCAMIVRRACTKMGGCDPFSLPGWKSKRKALRVFAECGGMATALAGVARRVGRGFAQTGDIALLEDETALGNSLMVVIEDKVLVSQPETGVTLEDRFTLPPATSFWRIDGR